MNSPGLASLLLPIDAFDTRCHQVMGRRVAGSSFSKGFLEFLLPGLLILSILLGIFDGFLFLSFKSFFESSQFIITGFLFSFMLGFQSCFISSLRSF